MKLINQMMGKFGGGGAPGGMPGMPGMGGMNPLMMMTLLGDDSSMVLNHEL